MPKISFDPKEEGFTTKREKEFLDGLGKLKRMPRLQLLENYLESMKNRFNWGNIDKDQIKEYVIKTIKLEKEKAEEKTKPKGKK